MRFLPFVLGISVDLSMTVQASSGQTCCHTPSRSCKDERVGATRGLVLLELDKRVSGVGQCTSVSDVGQCTSVSEFLKRFANNLPKGLQSVPQKMQERIRNPFSHVEVDEIGRARMEEKYNQVIGRALYSKEDNNAGVRSFQASFPRAEVNEIGRVRVEEEYKLKDRKNDFVVRSPQASFPSAEVKEIDRVWMDEEYDAAIGQPSVVEMNA